MKVIKQTLALLALIIGISGCASILGINKDVMMSVEKGMSQKKYRLYLGSRTTAVSTTTWRSGSS